VGALLATSLIALIVRVLDDKIPIMGVY
jgi:hypothetical protein